jgi:hypothetical protein
MKPFMDYVSSLVSGLWAVARLAWAVFVKGASVRL